MNRLEENERICLELLRWKKRTGDVWGTGNTPPFLLKGDTFDTWARAGAIMDELQIRMQRGDRRAWDAVKKLRQRLRLGSLGPVMIRATALNYLNAVEADQALAQPERAGE